jgi:hypothetical protein
MGAVQVLGIRWRERKEIDSDKKIFSCFRNQRPSTGLARTNQPRTSDVSAGRERMLGEPRLRTTPEAANGPGRKRPSSARTAGIRHGLDEKGARGVPAAPTTVPTLRAVARPPARILEPSSPRAVLRRRRIAPASPFRPSASRGGRRALRPPPDSLTRGRHRGLRFTDNLL